MNRPGHAQHQKTSEVYECLRPLMHAKGVSISPEEFHQSVNVIYHRFESSCYDKVHREMWESLPRQFDILTGDLLGKGHRLPAEISLLDIGCGTGLGSQLLLQTALGPRIKHVVLLDTSEEMLKKSAARAAKWGISYTLVNGMLDQSPSQHFDLILASSLLHHIPDLAAFTQQLRQRQAAHGVFLHLQDPNADHAQDPELLQRLELLKRLKRKPAPGGFDKAFRLFNKLLGRNHLDKVNHELLRQGIIQHPMTNDEIWSVTDIHESGLPFSTGQGISLKKLSELFSDCALVSSRSYAFFGKLWSELPDELKLEEERLINTHAPNGRLIAAVWQRQT